jgi:hypothetical protein
MMRLNECTNRSNKPCTIINKSNQMLKPRDRKAKFFKKNATKFNQFFPNLFGKEKRKKKVEKQET